jgi:hypothetical protein
MTGSFVSGFALAGVLKGHIRERIGLDAMMAVVLGGEGAFEVGGRLWCLPAKIAHGGRSVRDALEHADFGVGAHRPFDFALRSFDFEGVGVESGCGE